MSLKRILALTSGDVGDERALSFAAQLANHHDAQAVVIPTYPDSSAEMIALGVTLGARLSESALSSIVEAEQALQTQIETLASDAARTADIASGAGDGAPRLSVMTRDLRPAAMRIRAKVPPSQKGSDRKSSWRRFAKALHGLR